MNSLRRPANVLLATSLGLVLTGCASGGSPSSSNADGDAPPKPASRASSGESTSRATRGGGARGAARRELESRGKKFEVDDFIEAAEKNDVELLQVFFDAGMDANAKDQYGRTAIMGAAERGRIGAIKLLLEKGADPNYYPPSFDSPLLIAAQHGESEAIRVLVAGGANVDQPAGATQGGTPLTRAADVDQWDAVKALIDLGADPNLTYDSTTALFKAAEKGNEPIVRFLLEKGADPNKRAPGGA
ncbi:MAG: ankyrin repeat domain-containing protein, partial [Acidobacteria bacterium]|nr:ankyrin repeat domain-containing protein [Acidobacteriota bacterium]